jgi:hypothetical protein
MLNSISKKISENRQSIEQLDKIIAKGNEALGIENNEIG